MRRAVLDGVGRVLRGLAGLLNDLAVLSDDATPRARCTGVSASWCPVHGDCLCTDECPDCGRSGPRPVRRLPPYSDGFRWACCCGAEWESDAISMDCDGCPLHGPGSEHAEGDHD